MQQGTAVQRFVENLRLAIKFRDTTITAVAEAAGIARPNLHRILRGEENVTLDRAEKIAVALHMDLEDLLSGKFPIAA